MVRKDYLLRVIEQFAAFLEKILFHKQAGDYAGAEQQIDATVKTLLGLDPELLYAMGTDQILTTVVGDTKFDMDICLVIAELYNQKADMAKTGSSEKLYGEYLERSFLLYAEAIRHGADNRSYRDRILALVAALRQQEVTDILRLKFVWYYEFCGLFAKAEDILYELVDSGFKGIRNIGLEFYRRLADKEDSLLAIGNLPRKEVEEGFIYFSKMPEPDLD